MSVPYEEKATQALTTLGLQVALTQLDQAAQQAAAGAMLVREGVWLRVPRRLRHVF